MGKIVKRDEIMKFVKNNASMMDSALARMGRDVKQIAQIRVPFKEGDLQKAIEVKRISKLNHRVEINKEYASYQEYGKRNDGSRKVRNYTTPGTGKEFLSGAGKTVAKDSLNYLKQAANTVKV